MPPARAPLAANVARCFVAFVDIAERPSVPWCPAHGVLHYVRFHM
jgi:hypothetical protein